MADVVESLENSSIYLILSLRGALSGFHWSIFVPTEKPKGEVWHATNPSGGWSLEAKTTKGIPNSLSLCVCLKLGVATSQNWATLRNTLQNVPADGQPSPNTGEAFSCRVWVKDAILALHNAGVIHLTMAIEEIEKTAMDKAEDNRTFIEGGTGPAQVDNDTGFSTTA